MKGFAFKGRISNIMRGIHVRGGILFSHFSESLNLVLFGTAGLPRGGIFTEQ